MGAGELIGRAYLPSGFEVVAAVASVAVAVVAAGYALQRVLLPRAVVWGVLVAAVAGVERLTAAEPTGLRMLALCALMLYGMKAVVGDASRRAGQEPLDARRWLAFALLWFGMRPRAFQGLGGAPRPGAARLARRAARNALAGAVLLALAWWADQRLVVLLLGLPALSLLVHFGLFHALAALWRARGADVGPLFRDPPRARSLAEFWSRRWNLAFSEMTSLALHRPLRARLGAGPATTVAFLYSGLLHELAISLPVRAGWGGPSAYFGLHAIAMLAERRLALAGGWARAWTVAWVLLPLPLLFHGPFLRGVIDPLLGLG